MRANGSKGKSWNATRVADLLGIDFPIVQAPFGGFASQHLTATVSNLGGLGSFGAVTLSGPAIREAVDEIRTLTSEPFAVNLWVSTSDRQASQVPSEVIEKKIRELARYYAELGIEAPSQLELRAQDFDVQVRAVIDAGVTVLSFLYGVPPLEILDECRRRAIKTIGTATTLEEAVMLEKAGVDLIVASGFEGGGHRGSFLRSPAHSLTGVFSLIPEVADAVEVPVIAAGGIADGRGLAAALVLGAEGVQIGTAFLACAGSGASKTNQTALVSKAGTRTNLTDAFTGRLARGLENRLMEEWSDIPSPPLPFPLQHALTQTIAAPASAQERGDLMTFWAGQSVGLCHHTDAHELMAELIAKADAFFPNVS